MQAGAHTYAIPNAFALAVAGPLGPAQPAGDTHPEPVAERDRRPQRRALVPSPLQSVPSAAFEDAQVIPSVAFEDAQVFPSPACGGGSGWGLVESGRWRKRRLPGNPRGRDQNLPPPLPVSVGKRGSSGPPPTEESPASR